VVIAGLSLVAGCVVLFMSCMGLRSVFHFHFEGVFAGPLAQTLHGI